MENGIDLSQIPPQPEELVVTLYKNISFGIGSITEEDGTISGVMFDWFVPATPWKHERMPIDREPALKLAMDILSALNDGNDLLERINEYTAPETPSDSGV